MTGPAHLHHIWRKLTTRADDRLKFRQLAVAFVDAPPRDSIDAVEVFEQLGHCVIPYHHAVTQMGTAALADMKASGFVGEFWHRVLGDLLVCRVPELLAEAAAQVVALRFTEFTDDSYAAFMRATRDLPLADVAGASAIGHIGDRDSELAGELVDWMLLDAPEVNWLREGSRISILTTRGSIHATFGAGTNERTVGNIHPFLVLSRLALAEMEIPVNGASVQARIMSVVGSEPDLMRRIDTKALQDMVAVHMHELPTGESVVCHWEGFVEPIALAMLFHMSSAPDEMVALTEYAIENNRDFLVWRLFLASTYAATDTRPELAANASTICQMAAAYWDAKYGGIGTRCPGIASAPDDS